jgi:hypothetical protein
MSASLPPTFEPSYGSARTHLLKRPLFVAVISALATLIICTTVGLFIYFAVPYLSAPPEDVDISVVCPTQIRSGDAFDVQVRINNLANRARVLDSIDVYDGFLAGALIQRSTPPWRNSSHLYGAFVTYDFQMDIPAHAETVVTFRAQALKEGDFMDDWAVCVDSPSSCAYEVLRTIISEREAGQIQRGPDHSR